MNLLEATEISAVTGTEIYRRSMASPQADLAKKVLLLHGLGDHIACHDWAAKLLLRAGFSPEGFDFPGHGQSAGRRGDVEGADIAIRLIDEMVDQMEIQPIGAFAHSTGGFLLLHYLDEKIRRGEKIPFNWIWLNSPLLSPDHNQPALKQNVARWLGKYFPRLTFSTGVRHLQCCHIEGAQKDDPRINFDGCHNRVSLRYGNSLLKYSKQGFSEETTLVNPLRILLSQGDEDPICPPQIAMDFFRGIPATDKTFVLVKGALHEAFREANPHSLFNSVSAWLDGC